MLGLVGFTGCLRMGIFSCRGECGCGVHTMGIGILVLSRFMLPKLHSCK